MARPRRTNNVAAEAGVAERPDPLAGTSAVAAVTPDPAQAGAPDPAAAARRVLAVLAGGAGGAALIECAAALAHALQRELALVQVQSTLALQAAALPETRALAHAGASWAPFAPADLERAWRAEAAGLRALAEPLARRQGLPWSLSSVRGELPEVARTLLAGADLLFIAAARPVAAPTQVLAVLDDGSASARRALQLAASIATGTPRPRRVRPLPLPVPPASADALDELLRRPWPADLLVLPRALATATRWARLTRLASLGCAVLLVD
jgi:hypothetical protein